MAYAASALKNIPDSTAAARYIKKHEMTDTRDGILQKRDSHKYPAWS